MASSLGLSSSNDTTCKSKKRTSYVIEEEDEEEQNMEYGTLVDSKSRSFDPYFNSLTMALKIYWTFQNTVSTMNSYEFSLPKIQDMCWIQFNESGTDSIYKNVFSPHKRRRPSALVESEWGIFFQVEAMCLQRLGNLHLSKFYLDKGKDLLLKVYFSNDLSKEEEYKASFGLILVANNMFAHGSLQQCNQLLQNIDLDKSNPTNACLIRFYERTLKGTTLLQRMLNDEASTLLEQSKEFLSLCGCPAA